MAPLMLVVLFLALLPILHFLSKPRWSKKLPPGSLGIPFIGQSLSFLQALQANRAEEWVAHRIKKYGPISKLSLFGSPTIILTGPHANRFIFTDNALAPQQPKSVLRILGERNMLELIGEEHKRVRGAVGQFLKPEVLKNFVKKIDRLVRNHVEKNWIGQQTVTVLPLSKSLTFDIISALMFGIKDGPLRDGLIKDFRDTIAGVWAVPVNLPFTNFSRGLSASKRIRKVLTQLVKERRAAFEQGSCNTRGDLISYLISLGENEEVGTLTDEEIVDNAMLVMAAGYETSSILITFMIRQLANDPCTLAVIVREQEAIAKSKPAGESLTWEDLPKMKFTWRVAMETLRMIPPVFGSFRKVLKDVEFNGYLIPKGWQVFWTSNITHMDKDIFSEPSKFDPMRFENQSCVPPYSFIAFGAGPRMCPGAELARVETLVMMHYVTLQFNWKLCCKEDIYWRDPMPSPSGGLAIQLEPKTSVASN